MSVLILNMPWTFFFWWNPSLIRFQTAKPVVFEHPPCLKRIWSIATRTKGGSSAFGPGTANGLCPAGQYPGGYFQGFATSLGIMQCARLYSVQFLLYRGWQLLCVILGAS
jgi:hypothetical protein